MKDQLPIQPEGVDDERSRLHVREMTDDELKTVVGAATPVNFELNTYLFTIGAGAVFDGGS